MLDSSNNNKRIAKNTIFLFFRMILTMLVSLYTSRVVLNTLGVENFGILNVVGGFVAMFSLISGSINTTISRFLTYELALDNPKRLNVVFSTSVNIQLILCVIIFVLAETVGLWFVNYEMTIPEERLYAANWVYQCSLASFFVVLISAPYNAVIIAHEKMSVYAYFSILEVFLKLLIVYLLVISSWDKLICYAFLLLFVSVLMRFLYSFYCNRHFEESIYHFVFNKSILKEMGKFAGWNYLGAIAAILRTQGLNVLMNIFFGVTVNAARGIATQVESAVVMLVNNFTVAMSPQITKSFATGDKVYMYSLICRGAKYSYFLMLLASIPIMAETPIILHLWLGNVPDYAVVFLRLTLIVVLLDTLSDTLTMAMQATTDIKKFQTVVSSIVLLVLPLCYVCYRIGMPVYVGYIICATAMVAKLFAELPLLRNMVGLPVGMFFNLVIAKTTIVTIASAIAPLLIINYIDPSMLRLIFDVIASVLWNLICISFVGLTREERFFFKTKMMQLKNKLAR